MLFFVSQFASEREKDEGNEFMITEVTVKVCFLIFQRISGFQVFTCSFKSLSIGSVLSLVTMAGVIEVHLLGYFIVPGDINQ